MLSGITCPQDAPEPEPWGQTDPANVLAVPRGMQPVKRQVPKPAAWKRKKQALVRVGERVRLLADLVFTSGRKLHRGDTGYVQRVPGRRPGELCQVRSDTGVVYGARANVIQIDVEPYLPPMDPEPVAEVSHASAPVHQPSPHLTLSAERKTDRNAQSFCSWLSPRAISFAVQTPSSAPETCPGAPKIERHWFAGRDAGVSIDAMTDELRRDLPPAAIRKVVETFNASDKNRDRALSRDECVDWLRRMYHACGWDTPTMDELQDETIMCLLQHDVDRDGLLNLREVCSYLKSGPMMRSLQERYKTKSAVDAALATLSPTLQARARPGEGRSNDSAVAAAFAAAALRAVRKNPEHGRAAALFRKIGDEEMRKAMRELLAAEAAERQRIMINEQQRRRAAQRETAAAAAAALVIPPPSPPSDDEAAGSRRRMVDLSLSQTVPTLSVPAAEDEQSQDDVFSISVFDTSPQRSGGDSAPTTARSRRASRVRKPSVLVVDGPESPKGDRRRKSSVRRSVRRSICQMHQERFEDTPTQGDSKVPPMHFFQVVRTADAKEKDAGRSRWRWKLAKEKMRVLNQHRGERIMAALRVGPLTAAKLMRWIARARQGVKERWYEQLSERLRKQAMRQGVVTEVPAEGDSNKQMQGNAALLAPDVLKRRLALRDHRQVRSAMRALYDSFPHCLPPYDALIDRQIYEWLTTCLLRNMIDDARERAELVAGVTDDWWNDSGGCNWFMNYGMFYAAMFDLVDMWTEGTDSEEYVTFIEQMQATVQEAKPLSWSIKVAQRQWREYERRCGQPFEGRAVTDLAPAELPFAGVRGGGGIMHAVVKQSLLAQKAEEARRRISRMHDDEAKDREQRELKRHTAMLLGSNAGSPRRLSTASGSGLQGSPRRPSAVRGSIMMAASPSARKRRSEFLSRRLSNTSVISTHSVNDDPEGSGFFFGSPGPRSPGQPSSNVVVSPTSPAQLQELFSVALPTTKLFARRLRGQPAPVAVTNGEGEPRTPTQRSLGGSAVPRVTSAGSPSRKGSAVSPSRKGSASPSRKGSAGSPSRKGSAVSPSRKGSAVSPSRKGSRRSPRAASRTFGKRLASVVSAGTPKRRSGRQSRGWGSDASVMLAASVAESSFAGSLASPSLASPSLASPSASPGVETDFE